MCFSTVCHFLLCHYLTRCIKPTGYGWEKLLPGSLVIDVGGGVGSQSLIIARRHPNLRFVVQDREAVIGDANEVRCASIPISVYTSS
jgi:ubiquinone/menaquinone biosynthesis C-methylase UbiE